MYQPTLDCTISYHYKADLVIAKKLSMVGVSKMRGCPPLALSETLYSNHLGNIEFKKERKIKMMTWEQLKR